MTSNNPAQQQQEQPPENEIKQPVSRHSRSYFVTSPIDINRTNALQDRELRPYLRRSGNFNKLVKAGILLADGRVVCSEEQWSETREIILRNIEEVKAARSSSESPEKSLPRKAISEKTGSVGNESSSPPRTVAKNLKSATNSGIENKEDTDSDSDDELWGNMSGSSNQGSSKEKPPRRGSAYSQSNLSRQSAGRNAGKTSSIGYMKDERTSDAKKKLREQDAINKQRIIDQVRRDEQKKDSVQERQHKSSETGQGRPTRKRLTSANSDNLAERIGKADMRVLKTLQQSREKLKMIENSDHSIKQQTNSESGSSSQSVTSFENSERIFFDLLRRQERLFRSLGERNIDELPALIEAIPPSLNRKYEEIYKEYSPHVELQRLLSDLICSKVSTDTFYRDASALVKMMHPGRILEYFGKYLASLNGPRKLLKVSLKSVESDDRYALTWKGEAPSKEKALTIGTRLVDDIIEHARSVHTYLTESSGASLSMLGMGKPDPMGVVQKQITLGDMVIESHTDEHVTFNERNVVCARPLEPGMSVADLKPVVDRPPTPIPEEQKIRRKSREVLAAKSMEMKKNARDLLQEVREEADRKLKKKMKQDNLKNEKTAVAPKRDPSLPLARGRLIDRVKAKLQEWKILQRNRSTQYVKNVESLSDLVPELEGATRDKYVRALSRQVAKIVGQTIQQAQDIILDAMNMPPEPEDGDDDESDEFESVSSAVGTEPNPEEGAEQENSPEESPEAEPSATFVPVFGSKPMDLDQRVLAQSLAAISVKHEVDGHSHAGHEHAPPVSHMKQFFKTRASMPAVLTGKNAAQQSSKKRHSMPVILPECMNPTEVHDRHSFMSLVRPDVKTLPEYQDMTLRQVQSVLQDHSLFSQIQELSPGESDEEINSEDLGQADEEILPKFQRERLHPANLPDEEERDSVSALPNIDDHERVPRAVASMPIPPRVTNSDDASDGTASPPPKTQSLTTSRMMLRCDSDPRLSLRSSKAEVKVGIQEHSTVCEQHEVHTENEEDLQKLESSAFGINANRTSSASKVGFSDEENQPVRRSGSADGEPALLPNDDSDDEVELRTRHPRQEDEDKHGEEVSRYY